MNYEAVARSNYFRVKDAEAFQREVREFPDLLVLESDSRFALFSTSGSGWPTFEADDDSRDLIDVLHRNLASDSVAVLVEAGSEGDRYVIGRAVAVAPEELGGGTHAIDLEDIYEVAQRAYPTANVEAAAY